MIDEDKMNILKQEVSRLTNEIVKKQEEIMELDVIRDVLQKEVELYEPISQKNDEELPF